MGCGILYEVGQDVEKPWQLALAVELFSKLKPENRERVIDQMKTLLSEVEVEKE